MAERGITVEITVEALDKLSDARYDPDFGAGKLKRFLERTIKNPMSEMILRGEVPNGSKVVIESNDKSSEDMNEWESMVDIIVTQPKK